MNYMHAVRKTRNVDVAYIITREELLSYQIFCRTAPRNNSEDRHLGLQLLFEEFFAVFSFFVLFILSVVSSSCLLSLISDDLTSQ